MSITWHWCAHWRGNKWHGTLSKICWHGPNFALTADYMIDDIDQCCCGKKKKPESGRFPNPILLDPARESICVVTSGMVGTVELKWWRRRDSQRRCVKITGRYAKRFGDQFGFWGENPWILANKLLKKTNKILTILWLLWYYVKEIKKYLYSIIFL